MNFAFWQNEKRNRFLILKCNAYTVWFSFAILFIGFYLAVSTAHQYFRAYNNVNWLKMETKNFVCKKEFFFCKKKNWKSCKKWKQKRLHQHRFFETSFFRHFTFIFQHISNEENSNRLFLWFLILFRICIIYLFRCISISLFCSVLMLFCCWSQLVFTCYWYFCVNCVPAQAVTYILRFPCFSTSASSSSTSQ